MTQNMSQTRRLVVLAALALIIVAGAITISQIGGKDSTARAAIPPGAASVDGIEEHDGILGDPKAPVLLTEYADLQCPICRQYTTDTLPEVVTQLVRTGKVRLALQPLQFLGPDSERAARVAQGAQAQGKLWAFIERMYAEQGAENSGWVSDDVLTRALKDAGANPAKALAQADGPAATKRLSTANQLAQASGVDSTPSFSIEKGDHAPVGVDANALDAGDFVAAVRQAAGS